MLSLTTSTYISMLLSEILVICSAILQPKRMDDKKLEQFLPYLEGSNVSEETKIEILRDLWKVMESFADEAWGIGPFHQPKAKKPGRNSN